MRKIFTFILLSIAFLNFSSVFWAENIWREDVIVWKWDTLFKLWPSDKVDLELWVKKEDITIKHFLATWEKYLLWVVAIIAIAMFIYIWYELATAEWKQDQFTKWMKALIYLVVWLAVIPLAYVIVKIVTWFNF